MALTWEAAREAAAKAAPVAGWQRGALADKYVVPPFSIMNTMSSDWTTRKHFWLAMGIQSELGRGEAAVGGAVNPATAQVAGGGMAEQMLQAKHKGKARAFAVDLMHSAEGDQYEYGRKAADQRSNVTQAPLMPEYAAAMGLENMAPGTSIFDPVLCEIVYRWWCPDGGVILDPFAGGSVRGIVAGYMGHPYVGVDLSGQQIEANREQARRILTPANKPQPAWHVGDSLQVLPTLDVTADLVFTCPPYYDLEVYSDDPADISNMPWPAFLAAYRRIIGEACDKLQQDRFAVIVVGEVRDKRHPDGGYIGLVPETIKAFTDAGLTYYNEVVLVNAAGSLPVRTGHQFEATRKVGKQHQNVLVFVKGRVSRGWSVDRTPPPSPQQGLDDLIDQPVVVAQPDPPAQPVAAPASPTDPPAADPAPVPATADPAQQRPSVVDPAAAIVEYQQGLAARIDPADGWRRFDEGRVVQASTGETRPEPVLATLTTAQVDDVRKVAARVTRLYEQGKRAHMKFHPPAGMSIADVCREGFGAELAVATYVGGTWNRGDRKRPDVGDNLEVRWTQGDPPYLALYDYDKRDRLYVLATGSMPAYRLAGQLTGADGMRDDYLTGQEHPRWRVPVGDLRPVAALRRVDQVLAEPPPVAPASRAAPPQPAGLAVGDVATDTDGWACTACGGPPDGPLRTTVQPDIRRGACPSCHRDKPFLRS